MEDTMKENFEREQVGLPVEDPRHPHHLCMKALEEAQSTIDLQRKLHQSASSRATRYLQDHIAERDEYADTHYKLEASEAKTLHVQEELTVLRQAVLQAAGVLFELAVHAGGDTQDLPQTVQRIAGQLTDAT
ncbi:hypothetical protein V5O48_017699 [Marasmius crinis-equi]|uniref:Uncharacterized protein n=1 Tax=Marasmius crinis-equi TaxID=585013 RepID=A0ABR3EN97_9AGAR